MKEANQKISTVCFHLYEVSKVVKFIEAGSRMVVPRGWEEGGNGESLFNGYRGSVLQDEKVLGIGCIIMGIYSILMNCTLENGSDGKLHVVCIRS